MGNYPIAQSGLMNLSGRAMMPTGWLGWLDRGVAGVPPTKDSVRALIASVSSQPRPHLPFQGEPRINAEPINALFWDGVEERFGAEIYLRAPNGDRGGALFGAVKDDVDLTAELDRVALATIARALMDRDRPELDDLPILSVNVCQALLQREEVSTYLENGTFDLNRAVFELPERLTSAEHLARLVHLRKQHPSVQFALDDIFATNYNHYPLLNSLGTLFYVKIDWRFFHGAFRSSYGRRMLRIAIKSLLDKGHHVVVEGVNAYREKRFLANLLEQGESIFIQGNTLPFAETPPQRSVALADQLKNGHRRDGSRRPLSRRLKAHPRD